MPIFNFYFFTFYQLFWHRQDFEVNNEMFIVRMNV